MHLSQRDPRELKGTEAAFMEMVCRMVTGPRRRKNYIINMDQSPIPFTFDRQRTLELVGAVTVHICKLTFDTKWATLVVSITVSGKILTFGCKAE